ncbi:MAG: DUF3850 domain-containing protein [Clostridia bacterium]|nr:DUF3850 domain-containing protein [Clostridia bacterium]
MIHDLKISPVCFDAVAQGIKPFEVRKIDRLFSVGDVLRLREWYGNVYTLRTTRKVITYILNDPDYCKEGYVILGLAPATREEKEV